MSTRFCVKCDKEFTYSRKFKKYCPDCSGDYTYSRACSTCKNIFTTRHYHNYQCGKCRSKLNKAYQVSKLYTPKPKPVLITDEEQYAIDMKFRENTKCEFIHLKRGMPGFDELASKVTPIQMIKKSYFMEPIAPYEFEDQRKSLFGSRRENTKELR